jgi:protein-S-isoprenylcysteine O-methyltransferase Ste14
VSRVQAALGSGLFLFVAPGVMAGLIPYALTGWESTGPPVAVIVLGTLVGLAGLAIVLATFARFVMEGRGTPAPVAPTEQLVVGGLYRRVRNPMYVGVIATILGQALILGRPVLLIYAAGFWLLVASFVRFYEEPTLRERYGDSYDAYCREVPAWLRRLRPSSPRVLLRLLPAEPRRGHPRRLGRARSGSSAARHGGPGRGGR